MQLPRQPVFQPLVAQQLQALRTAAGARRKAALQRAALQASTFNANLVGGAMPCDPNSQALRIKYVSPAEVRPADAVVIEGCNFQTKDSQSEAILSALAHPHPLDIDSWTATTIKARIPPLEGFSDTVSATLEVHKGSASVTRPIKLRPPLEVQIVGDFTKLITVDHPSGDCLAMKDTEQWSMGGVSYNIPKIEHFSTKQWCQGKDTIKLQSLKLPNDNYTFHAYQFLAKCLVFDASGVGSWSTCWEAGAKLDQNLGDIDGKTSLPDVTVTWYNQMNQGVAYTLTILVEGPKGIIWQP